MTLEEKIDAITRAIQVDPGNRGLGELFEITSKDYFSALLSFSWKKPNRYVITTGFYIPSAQSFETDGPPGALCLSGALQSLGYDVAVCAEVQVQRAMLAVDPNIRFTTDLRGAKIICIERGGPTSDGRCRTMRGVDNTAELASINSLICDGSLFIGIGDGGNEIGMGKIPHETIVKNIPNGDKIHCVVPTDHLIVAGVSNWGAYALAAGIFVLKGITPPPDLFDPDREREILKVMVREGPLVDGVTGKQEATVDGLSWEEYSRPLVEIARILRN
jgi:D-glutamate cyclase